MADNTPPVELRGNCPRDIVDVLDAVSQSRRSTRMELVNQILREWVDGKLLEAELIRRVTGGGK
jgi:hypothetical protein